MNKDRRYCRKCLLADSEAGRASLQKYLEAIHAEDKTTDDIYGTRLETCRGCEQLGEDGTCFSCGCYVEFRAILKDGRCPKKKWN